jgi:FKBP-type peptidyl-prolyl cis-trans isomerase FklB
MKAIILAVVFSAGAVAPLFADGTNSLTDEKSRVSYAIGMMLGHSWQQEGVDVDADIAARAIKDEQAGGPTLLTTQEATAVLTEFKKTFGERVAAKNKAEGEAFLATNKNNPGVVTLPDGLQYKIVAEGKGATPSATDIVTVNYSGRFINGTEFDSSAKAGHPAQFPVGGVIRGWTEALLKMKVGAKWQLFIPSNLAYGEQGRPGIPPNATLIFDVELLSSQPQNQPSSSMAPQNPPLTSDIIKVPSAEEMKKGAKIETIKPEDLQKMQSQNKTN